jgi:hypothetical protein
LEHRCEIGLCWTHLGGTVTKGYGQASDRGQSPIHRYVWERLVGPIPDGMVLDHMCRNRACCNPDHLRVVSPKVNSTENVVGSGWQKLAARTHCKNGHEFSPENTRQGWTANHRVCRTCERERLRAWRIRNGGRWEKVQGRTA